MKKKLALLLKIGFPKELAEMMVKAEDLADDFDEDGSVETARTALAESFKADAAFMKDIRTPIVGEVLAGRERQLMKLAKDVITQQEFDALPKEGRFDKALELAITKLKEPKKEGDPKGWDEERTKLLGEIQTLTGTITEYKEKTVPGLEKKAVDVEHNFHIRGAIQAAALKGDRKTVLALEKTAGLLHDDIGTEFDLGWDPAKKSVVVKQKGTDLPAMDPKERSRALGIDDVVGAIGEKNGYFVLNNGGEKGPAGGGGNNTDTPKFKLPGMAKAAAHAKAGQAAQ